MIVYQEYLFQFCECLPSSVHCTQQKSALVHNWSKYFLKAYFKAPVLFTRYFFKFFTIFCCKMIHEYLVKTFGHQNKKQRGQWGISGFQTIFLQKWSLRNPQGNQYYLNYLLVHLLKAIFYNEINQWTTLIRMILQKFFDHIVWYTG